MPGYKPLKSISAGACARANVSSLDFESGTLARVRAPRTYGYASASQLETLAVSLGMASRLEEFLDLQETLFAPWADCEVPREPAFASAIGDDHSPYEYSVAFARNETELRILFEAQAMTPSLGDNLRAALDVNERLAEHFNCDFSKFDAIRDLFIRTEPQPPFALWHAVCLTQNHAPEFKVYLNPAAWGDEHRADVVGEAMGRLGFADAARALFDRSPSRGRNQAEVRYFSIDLARAAGVRVKVYFAHPGADANDLELEFARAPSHQSGDVERFCSAVVNQRGPFTRKPVTSCVSFISGKQEPSAVTLHVPVAHYARNDADTVRRVSTFLDRNHLPGKLYAHTVQAFAGGARGLLGNGVQSYSSFRRERDGLRFTSYLSPELFRRGE